ncbi:MAG: DNA-packaging protein [Alphaproteobacteria bacterium]|nr:DNA-packaging protein [Alphaproteobacteria bacterium]
MNDDTAAFLRRLWTFWARDEQLAPPGRWRVWLYLGGRGAGKTRAGAEWVAGGVKAKRMRRIALVGATYNDARAVMIEGESGLLSVAGAAQYQPSNHRLRWPNGAVATVLSAEEPDGIRGHQFDAAWCDEFCKWSQPDAALDMLRMALRLGKQPRMAITTTPRNLPALARLMEARGTKVTRSSTRDNAANLAPGFVEDLEARYGGTRLGRQELDAEIIADVESALWKRDWIERGRLRAAPELVRIVVAVDPPATSHGAACGIVVAGLGADGKGYVLADRSMAGLTPLGWSQRVAEAFELFDAGCIVAESNQGGEMVKAVLVDQLKNAPVRLVNARKSKTVRAEPVALLYETGRIHHVGVFPELEDQLCNYEARKRGESPDRLDALVWALSDLFPVAKAGPSIRKV